MIAVTHGMAIVTAICLTCAVTAATATPYNPQPMTPEDALQTTRILDCIPVSPCVSPDRTRYAVRLVRGGLRCNCVVMQLVAGRMDSARESSQGTVVARLSSAALASNALSGPDTDTVSDANPLRWLDSKRVAFLWVDRTGVHQVVVVNIVTGKRTYLTHSTTQIQAYDVAANETVIYSAQVAKDPAASAALVRSGFTVGARADAFSVLNGELADSSVLDGLWNTAWFVQRVGGSPRRLELGTGGEDDTGNPSLRFVKLSHDGRHALVAAPPRRVPADWDSYSNELGERSFIGEFRKDPRSWFGRDVLQLHVVDLSSAEVRPLLAAPASFYTRAEWAPDDRSVLVGPTFLPTQAAGGDGIDGTAVATVETATGQVELVPQSVPRGSRVYLAWASPNVVTMELIDAAGTDTRKTYRKESGGWLAAEVAATRKDEATDLELRQDIHTPPKLYWVDHSKGISHVVVDPNPRLLRDYKLGSVEMIMGSMGATAKWTGLLFKPVNYQKDLAYPLVIQLQRGSDLGDAFTLYGWSENSGLGPSQIAAYAAQPLASRGMAVVELQVTGIQSGTPEEPEAAQRAVEAVVRQLSAIKLIDPARVGLSGFSRNGYYVDYVLAHSSNDFAAATAVDNFDASYMQTAMANWSADSSGVNGAQPFGDGLATWVKNAPGFRVDHFRTPLQFVGQSGGVAGTIMSYWELFSQLRHLGKPVELYVMPDADLHGSHDPQNPTQILAVQRRVVDWFDFWLNGHEDSDPAKPEQYRRWEKLCDMQKAANPDRPTFCVGTKH